MVRGAENAKLFLSLVPPVVCIHFEVHEVQLYSLGKFAYLMNDSLALGFKLMKQ